MNRCQKIIEHPLYRECMKNIERAERERIFCPHGPEHALDTARIGYILILERGINIDKELFYAAALLHDSGRYNRVTADHAEAGAVNAELIMPECGFTREETAAVSAAILSHRTGGEGSILGEVLYEADKRSRRCYDCRASAQCYWDEERRNNTITI